MDLVEEVKSKLIRRDGKLNSPAIHSKKNADLVSRVCDKTGFLSPDASFAQRWWHLNNGTSLPVCYCGREIKWNEHSKFYANYCSQQCAVTSPEASNRTRNQFSGKKIPQEQVARSKITRKQNGYYKNRDETIQRLSEQKRGERNPQFGKSPWNKGLLGHANPNFGKKRPGTGKVGKSNPQYGKPPSPQAGRGISGRFNELHFRSSLELLYLIFWHEQGYLVESAETKKFRVEYVANGGNKRTYSPDFFIKDENRLVEIKPENLHTNALVIKKLEALKVKHPNKKCDLIGYKDIGDFIRKVIENNTIELYYNAGVLKLAPEQYERLKRNYADIVRATS